jgi:hypothetical protein
MPKEATLLKKKSPTDCPLWVNLKGAFGVGFGSITRDKILFG